MSDHKPGPAPAPSAEPTESEREQARQSIHASWHMPGIREYEAALIDERVHRNRAEARVRSLTAERDEHCRRDVQSVGALLECRAERDKFRLWFEMHCDKREAAELALTAIREAAGDVLMCWREDPGDRLMENALERLAKVLEQKETP